MNKYTVTLEVIQKIRMTDIMAEDKTDAVERAEDLLWDEDPSEWYSIEGIVNNSGSSAKLEQENVDEDGNPMPEELEEDTDTEHPGSPSDPRD